jgi:uncharacterized membrane protein
MIGDTDGTAFASALFETDDGLLPAFIVEEHTSDRYTVFVPAVPTPATGQLFIAPGNRVHKLDVPMRKVIQCISQWGGGADELVQSLDRSHQGRTTGPPRPEITGPDPPSPARD